MAPDLNLEIPAVTADWAVCVKPVGMECERELPAALSARIGGALFPVHRLDLNVGGLVVFARTRSAAAELSRQIQDGRFRKEYTAMVHGLPPASGRLEDLLWKDTRQKKVFVVSRMRTGVRPAALTYEVLRADAEAACSVIRVQLETGRTHQIRVQFASRGYPLVGDHKYGARDAESAPRLFSSCLRFFWQGEEQCFSRMPDWA